MIAEIDDIMASCPDDVSRWRALWFIVDKWGPPTVNHVRMDPMAIRRAIEEQVRDRPEDIRTNLGDQVGQ